MAIKERLENARWLIAQVRDRIDNRFLAALADVELVSLHRGKAALIRASLRYRVEHKLEIPDHYGADLTKCTTTLKDARARVTKALAEGILTRSDVYWLRSRPARSPEAVPA